MFRHARTHATLLGAVAALGTLSAASPALADGGSSSPGGVSPTSAPAPAGSGTSSGGAALTPTSTGLPASGPSSSTGSSTSTNPVVQPGDVTVSASGAGISLSTIASALLRNQLTFTGTAPVSDAGRTIEIDRLGHETQWTWQPTATATISPQGTFSVTWATDHIGEFEMRAVLSGSRAARVATASATASSPPPPTLLVTVYRPSVASWYGGTSMWGEQTACGVTLTRQTIGLANKTLACGTNVALYYQGQTLIVPVIDHGPYVNGRDWDLTEATAQALGITGQGVVTLGAVSLPKPPATVAMAG